MGARTAVLAAGAALLLAACGSSGPRLAAGAPTVAVVGDSYSAGVGADRPDHAWQYAMADRLGWRLVQTDASSGGGYAQRGDAGTFADAVHAKPLPADVGTVVLQGGLNDRAESAATIRAAVASTIALVRAQAPHARVIVVGTFVPSASFIAPYPRLLPNADVIRAGAAAAGVEYVDGRTCRFDLASDGLHPSTDGAAQLGDQVARLITSHP